MSGQIFIPKQQHVLGEHAPDIFIGVIVDVIGITGVYKVELPSGAAALAMDIRTTGAFTSMSPTPLGMYPPGSRVLVASIPGDYAIIIGVLPFQIGQLDLNLPEVIGNFTGAHHLSEITHYYYAQLKNAGGLIDYKSGRPFEIIPGSDDGLVNELGLGYGISRLVSWLKASEVCGVWAFYLDNLLRLGAFNFEMWHAGGEKTIYNDEGEVNETEKGTPYPWEAVGLLDPGDAFTTDDTRGVYNTDQQLGWVQPKNKDQILIPRYRHLRGYTGDLIHDWIQAPESKLVKSPETLASSSKYTGLLEVHHGIDGALFIRSARAVSISKYVAIPVPKDTAFPDAKHTSGDSYDNYAAAGKFGTANTQAHNKNEWTWAQDASAQPSTQLAQMWDYHSFFYNFYNVQTVAAHKRDFDFPEEQRAPGDSTDPAPPPAPGQPQQPPDPLAANYYKLQEKDAGKTAGQGTGTIQPGSKQMTKPTALGGTFQYPMPPFASLKVDHRYNSNIKYYKSRSALDLLPDGSVVLSDGYGSALTMSGGNIYISCPGDIFQQPGRNSVIMAGQDAIIRSQRGVDISAAKKDVRIKAERNLHVLGGNSDKGGVLIESRATGQSPKSGKGEKADPRGLILKSIDSVTMWGKALYTQFSDSMIFDCGKGEGDISVVADTVTRIIKSSSMDAYGVTPVDDGTLNGTPTWVVTDQNNVLFDQQGVFAVNADTTMLYGTNSNLLVSGELAVHENCVIGGNLAVGGGGVSNQGFAQGKFNAAATFQPLRAAFTKLEKFDTDEGVQAAKPAGKEYAKDKRGNKDTIKKVGFSYRNKEQYNLSDADFILTEQPWQQIYRMQDIGYKWDEPSVTDPSVDDKKSNSDSGSDNGSDGTGGSSGTGGKSSTSKDDKDTYPYPGKENWKDNETYVTNDLYLWDWDAGHATPRANAAGAKGIENEKKKLSDAYLVSVDLSS